MSRYVVIVILALKMTIFKKLQIEIMVVEKNGNGS